MCGPMKKKKKKSEFRVPLADSIKQEKPKRLL